MDYRYFLKGELQCQNKLISSERPFKILQNETKIIKIGQTVLEIFDFKDSRFGQFYDKKRTEKRKMLSFLEFLQKLKNNRLCDVRNDKYTIQQYSVSNISVCRANTSTKFYGRTV